MALLSLPSCMHACHPWFYCHLLPRPSLGQGCHQVTFFSNTYIHGYSWVRQFGRETSKLEEEQQQITEQNKKNSTNNKDVNDRTDMNMADISVLLVLRSRPRVDRLDGVYVEDIPYRHNTSKDKALRAPCKTFFAKKKRGCMRRRLVRRLS